MSSNWWRSCDGSTDVEVHCFGGPRDGAQAHSVPTELRGRATPRCRRSASTWRWRLRWRTTWTSCTPTPGTRTWAGTSPALLRGVPHVITAHCLEPRRPWKAEQLGGGYRVSSWAEATAYRAADAIIAVSRGMRADVLASYPDVDPATGARRSQRHRHGHLPPGGQSWSHQPAGDRPGPALHRVRRPDHPAEGPAAPAAGGAGPATGHATGALRLVARHPRAGRGGAFRGGAAAIGPGRGLGDLAGQATAPLGAHLGLHRGDRLRLPIGLRAARDREPRGDGLRDSRGRQRCRGDPRGGGRRHDRPARALRRAATRPSSRPTWRRR